MDRELVLAVLALALGGGAYALGELGGWSLARWRRGGGGAGEEGGARRGERGEAGEARARRQGGGSFALERRAWRRIWRPLAPGLLVLAFLIGWALQEPDSAEALPILAFAIALPFALLWARAGLRAARSARSAAGVAAAKPLAATVGLWRPRTILSPLLHEQLDAAALRAVMEHEAAHARHRDPLRLWLAQLVTDLQWPLSGARRRFTEWRLALELARDDEALARGVDGGDLAAGLLAVARLGARPPGAERAPGAALPGSSSGAIERGIEGAIEGAIAGLGAEGATQAFRQRVTRLLAAQEGAPATVAQEAAPSPSPGAPPAPDGPRASSPYLLGAGLRRPAALLVALGVALIALGYHHGELVISNLLGLGI